MMNQNRDFDNSSEAKVFSRPDEIDFYGLLVARGYCQLRVKGVKFGQKGTTLKQIRHRFGIKARSFVEAEAELRRMIDDRLEKARENPETRLPDPDSVGSDSTPEEGSPTNPPSEG